MVLLGFFVLFVVVPIAELYVIIQVGESIGALATIALLIADSIFGAWLLRHQGRGAWRRLNSALGEGRAPAREVADGGLIMLGGVLMLTPGFLTDIVGILLILPPTRAIFRSALTRSLARRMTIAVTGAVPPRGRGRGGSGPASGSPRRGPGGSPYDVEGTAVEVDPPGLTG